MTETFRRLYVALGRYGDVLGVLPVVRAHHDRTGQRPIMMTAEEFRPLLDGCSWLEPMVWRGPWQDCVEAVQAARVVHPDVEIVDASVYGVGFKLRAECMNFQREAWRLARSQSPWDRLPVAGVFDRRDRKREAGVVSSVRRGGRPLVLCSFSGSSAPFRGGRALVAEVQRACPGALVVDLSTMQCERIYDLLGLMEAAACLVCSDSAPLHLAAHVPALPVVSLIPDQSPRWNRAGWRPQYAAQFFYSEATLFPKLVAAEAARALERDTSARPTFWHVTSHVGVADVDTVRRMAVARRSWDEEAAYAGNWKRLEVRDAELPRTTATHYGEPRGCPFLRDVVDVAARKAQPHDVIVLSNSDVGFTPGLTGWITEALIRSEACFTHRWDSDVPIVSTPLGEHEVCRLRWYCGSDLWAFRRSWWDAHRAEIPDMALGREAVDLVLRQMIKLTDGVEIPGACWHEKHPSFWEHYGHRDTLPANLQNRVLATEFMRQHELTEWVDGREVRPGR